MGVFYVDFSAKMTSIINFMAQISCKLPNINNTRYSVCKNIRKVVFWFVKVCAKDFFDRFRREK